MKIIYRVLVILLVAALVGIGVTGIIKSQECIRRSEAAIASADAFLERYERRFGSGRN